MTKNLEKCRYIVQMAANSELKFEKLLEIILSRSLKNQSMARQELYIFFRLVKRLTTLIINKVYANKVSNSG